MAGLVWTILGLIGTALTGIFATSLWVVSNRETDWLEVVNLGALTTRPQRFALRYRQTQGWLVSHMTEAVYAHLENGHPVVYSSRCTHLGCAVHWEETPGEFRCPCHGGKFDSEGTVIAGPPRLPLNRLPVEIRNNRVRVRRA